MRTIFNIGNSSDVYRRRSSQGLLDLLFPMACLICEVPGEHICSDCIKNISPRYISFDLDNVRINAGALYSDSTAALVVLAKEENSFYAREALADLLYIGLQEVISESKFTSHMLIPMPSSKTANRKRGYKHSVSLTHLLMKRISLDKNQKNVFYLGDFLAIKRKTIDQSQLNAEQRRENLQGAFEFAQSSTSKKMLETQSWGLLLVDDVMTTGTTFKEAIRALRIEGFEPFAALCACVSGKRFY